MENQTSYVLSDAVIAHIAKLLQLAILSGTDVVDNLRMIRLCPSEDESQMLVLDKVYSHISDSHVEKMMTEIQNYKEHFDSQG